MFFTWMFYGRVLHLTFNNYYISFSFNCREACLLGDISRKFWRYLTLSLPEKLKKLIFEMPIIIQTLNIDNLRATSAKSINLNTIRKLVEYSLKNVPAKAMFNLTVLLPEGRSALTPAQRDTGNERVNFSRAVR